MSQSIITIDVCVCGGGGGCRCVYTSVQSYHRIRIILISYCTCMKCANGPLGSEGRQTWGIGPAETRVRASVVSCSLQVSNGLVRVAQH